MTLLRFTLLVLIATACTTPEATTPKTVSPAKINSQKTKITELFKCFKYENTPLEIAENENGFIRLGSMVNGSPRQGYSTIHLYKRGKYNIVSWIDYSCGPACEQTIKWHVVTANCKMKEIPANKIFPGNYEDASRFLSLSKKGKEAYIIEADNLDVYNEYEMRIEEKYQWKNGSFVKDDTFEPFSLMMIKENIDLYFTHKEK